MKFRHRALLQGLANTTPRWRKPVKVLALTPRTVILSHVSFLGCKHFLHLTLTITVYIKKDLDTLMVKRVFSCLNVFTDWFGHYMMSTLWKVFSIFQPDLSTGVIGIYCAIITYKCACFCRLNMALTHEQNFLPLIFRIKVEIFELLFFLSHQKILISVIKKP